MLRALRQQTLSRLCIYLLRKTLGHIVEGDLDPQVRARAAPPPRTEYRSLRHGAAEAAAAAPRRKSPAQR